VVVQYDAGGEYSLSSRQQKIPAQTRRQMRESHSSDFCTESTSAPQSGTAVSAGGQNLTVYRYLNVTLPNVAEFDLVYAYYTVRRLS
jgi:hypothetical protein